MVRRRCRRLAVKMNYAVEAGPVVQPILARSGSSCATSGAMTSASAACDEDQEDEEDGGTDEDEDEEDCSEDEEDSGTDEDNDEEDVDASLPDEMMLRDLVGAPPPRS